MPKTTITANTTSGNEVNLGIDGGAERGFRTLVYTGSLGGGTVRLMTEIEGVRAYIPNSKLTATTTDDDGNVVQSISFSANGTLYLELLGATAPSFDVAVK